jgi:hypothetical protein
MAILLASILAGALLCWTRHWFFVAFATIIFFVGTVVYEWKSGSGAATSLMMAGAICAALQMSFLTASLISDRNLAPRDEVQVAMDAAPPRFDEPVSQKNDRRSPANGLGYSNGDRRSPTNDL